MNYSKQSGAAISTDLLNELKYNIMGHFTSRDVKAYDKFYFQSRTQ